MNMSAEETRAVLTLCLMASFADGDKHERERDEIKRVAQNFSQGDAVHLSTVYQDVLMQRVTLSDVVGQLQSADAKRLGYEMAVCVCDADGTLSEPEQRFLSTARAALGLDVAASAAFVEDAQTLAELPMAAEPAARTGTSWGAAPLAAGSAADGTGIAPVATAAPVAAVAPSGSGTAGSALSGTAGSARPAVNEAELDSAILNAAIINGALELLPESLSTMAIIPLQMKLVWRIGKAYGFELDRGHIKDFLATVGVGLTSQYLEQAGRKLLGGLLGKVGGGLLRGVGQQAVSTGMSFATTYALGHVAKRYYAGGRTLSTQMLKDAYASTMQNAQDLSAQYRPDMQARAQSLNARSVMAMVRGA